MNFPGQVTGHDDTQVFVTLLTCHCLVMYEVGTY